VAVAPKRARSAKARAEATAAATERAAAAEAAPGPETPGETPDAVDAEPVAAAAGGPAKPRARTKKAATGEVAS
jgi:hypothetical protein